LFILEFDKHFEIGNFEKLETLAIKNEQKSILKELSKKKFSKEK